jgi:cell division protein FtsB
MTHQEIIDKEIVERYVLGKLPPDDRRQFQEHFFDCDECFQQAQAMSDTVSRVRYAADAGALDADKSLGAAASFWNSGWWRPVLVCSVAASLILAVAFVWLWFSRAQLQKELAMQRQASETAKAGAPSSSGNEQKLRELEAERAELQRRLDELEKNKPSPRPDEGLLAQGRVPSVMLESSRDSGSAAQITIPAGAKAIALRIPVEPGDRFQSFTVDVLTRAGISAASVNGARPNRSGSLIVNIPAGRLVSGEYRVKLHGVNQTQRELLAEYDLQVFKK